MTGDDLVATMFVNGERKVIAIQSAPNPERYRIMAGGGVRAGKSQVSRMMLELAREQGYDVVEMGPGVTGRIADTVILDELKHLQDIPQVERKVPQEPHYAHTMTNRKARRAQAAERRRRR